MTLYSRLSLLSLIFIIAVVPLTIMAHKDHSDGHDHSHDGTMTSHVEFRPLTEEELERFHGHLGPFVVLGAKMGEHAVTVHQIPRYFGLTVLVECPDSPPSSCLIDGLQPSTGATMGKRNIKITPAEEVKVTIINDDSGKKVIYKLKASTKALFKRWADENTITITERGQRVFKMEAEALFDIQVIEG